MTTYEFTLILADEPELTDDLCEALAAAGCDDGTIGQVCGVQQIAFDRQAQSLEAAIRSAIADVQKVGCRVKRLEMENDALVGVADALQV